MNPINPILPADAAEYAALCARALRDSADFWARAARAHTEWIAPWDAVVSGAFPDVDWFSGGLLNVTHDCLDRHVRDGFGDKVAIIAVDETGAEDRVTYAQLLERACRVAGVLRSKGVRKGDRVAVYMHAGVDQAAALLACARLGAVHCAVFAGYGAPALRRRLENLGAVALIASEYTLRRGNRIPLLAESRQAAEGLPLRAKLVLRRGPEACPLLPGEIDFSDACASAPPVCEPVPVSATDPLFVLFTSGSTGEPKGVTHAAGGYHVQTDFTMRACFGATRADTYWCTADFGWITGVSYGLYGPLSVGMTCVIAEGVPDFPTADRWWSIAEKYRATILYTAPTAVRMLRAVGDAGLPARNLSSLRALGSVGEPISYEVTNWFAEAPGDGLRRPVVDTWWQTETGGHMLANPAGVRLDGFAGVLPLPGIDAAVVDAAGGECVPGQAGELVLRTPWPGMMRGIWGDRGRFESYFDRNRGWFFTHDAAVRLSDGSLRVLGRLDDVLSVSGHRIGTAEIEGAAVAHPSVAEAAAVGVPHPIKGQSVKLFAVLRPGRFAGLELAGEIRRAVAGRAGAHAVPDVVEFVAELPKTASGKILRNVLASGHE